MAVYKKKCNDTQTGAVLVEFAFVLPLLALLLAGIVEFSFAFYHLNILNKSVEDGARYFSDPKIAKNGDVGSLIDTRLEENKKNINSARFLITHGTPDVTNPNNWAALMPGNYIPAPEFYCAEENKKDRVCLSTTQHVTVTATYIHTFILGELLSSFVSFFSPGSTFPTSYALTASSTMRVQ